LARRLQDVPSMFHSLARSMQNPLIWLMLPLAVLAGRPTAGCFCGDGTVKTVCAKTGWPLVKLGGSELTSSACCRNCRRDKESSQWPNCCPPQPGLPANDGGAHCSTANGWLCRALANNVEPAQITNWTIDTDDSRLHVPAAVLGVLPPAAAFHAASVPAESLPPPDRVVLFLHLTI
jgi:hypothetical protein